jgi:hypothetical protein
MTAGPDRIDDFDVIRCFELLDPGQGPQDMAFA